MCLWICKRISVWDKCFHVKKFDKVGENYGNLTALPNIDLSTKCGKSHQKSAGT